MKDLLTQDVLVGSKIIYADRYHYRAKLRLGVVTGITDSGATLEIRSDLDARAHRRPHEVVVFDYDPAVAKEFS